MYHRIGGAAFDFANGHKAYYENGFKHRIDGPAIIRPNSYNEYFQYGKRHKIGGPAIEFIDDRKIYTDGMYLDKDNCWFLDGILYSKEEYFKTVNSY